MIESRRAIRNLNTMYPDLSAEELANVADTTCIICREDMQAQQSIKRLACQHIFHKNCLRSWFQRQQTCQYHLRLRNPSDEHRFSQVRSVVQRFYVQRPQQQDNVRPPLLRMQLQALLNQVKQRGQGPVPPAGGGIHPGGSSAAPPSSASASSSSSAPPPSPNNAGASAFPTPPLFPFPPFNVNGTHTTTSLNNGNAPTFPFGPLPMVLPPFGKSFMLKTMTRLSIVFPFNQLFHLLHCLQ